MCTVVMTILTTNINTYLSLLSDDRQILSSKEIQIKHATKYLNMNRTQIKDQSYCNRVHKQAGQRDNREQNSAYAFFFSYVCHEP